MKALIIIYCFVEGLSGFCCYSLIISPIFATTTGMPLFLEACCSLRRGQCPMRFTMNVTTLPEDEWHTHRCGEDR